MTVAVSSVLQNISTMVLGAITKVKQTANNSLYSAIKCHLDRTPSRLKFGGICLPHHVLGVSILFKEAGLAQVSLFQNLSTTEIEGCFPYLPKC